MADPLTKSKAAGTFTHSQRIYAPAALPAGQPEAPLTKRQITRYSRHREHLINIQTSEGRAAAALTTSKRRGSNNDHEYVIGGFRMINGSVMLQCIYAGPAYDIDEQRTTTEANRFARWRTKQAAWAWLKLRAEWLDLRVIHLGRLDVLSNSRNEDRA